MKPRQKRTLWVLAGVAALAAAAALVFNALGSNLSMFITPSDVVAGKAPAGRTFRIGGLVEPGSLKRDADKVGGSFVVTDNAHSVRVAYSGILPDLFKEGRGVVAQGRLANDGSFVASEVLAKHDENYMPPEAAEALKRAGHPVGAPEQFRKPAKGVGAARGASTMIVEVGHFALSLALALALLLGIVPLIGAHRGDTRLMALAPRAAWAVFGLVAFAFACLVDAFVGHDFSVALVARHSNSALPLSLRIAASWGSHEGSMLLWTLMLVGWTAAVAAFSRSLAQVLRVRILAIMGLVAAGFLLFLLFTSNPFERLVPSPADGRDLNPLLQDPGMIFHPPMLYMGYVGLSVAFAFALAGLIGGRFDSAWARWARPWTTIAWCFLTLGIALGSFWSYYELGWGGWWFWDPVENASFMPWLVATALIHSLAVTEKRGAFRSWTVLLAILAFSLSLMGTFLVRSGVLTSVHAFATDPARGIFILGFLAIVIGGSLTLFAWRAPTISSSTAFEPISRESMLLANNVLLVVAMAAVLLGTLYPLVLDTLALGKISVGPPYFDAVFYPLMAPALFLVGVGPFARWRRASVPDLAVRLRWALAVAVASGLAIPALLSLRGAGAAVRPLISLGLAFSIWIAASVILGVLDMLRGPDGRLVPGAIGRRAAMHPASVWGMHLAHLGIAAFVLGVTLVNGYEVNTEQRLKAGDTVVLGDYRLRFESLGEVPGPNYDATRARFVLRRDSNPGAEAVVLEPEKRVYRANRQPMTEAAIDRGLTRDIYVSMGEPVGNGAWAVRLHIKPFVNWIWIGCVMMALGGFLAVADRRYRRMREARRARVDNAAIETP